VISDEPIPPQSKVLCPYRLYALVRPSGA
jgi:hypothetical protein